MKMRKIIAVMAAALMLLSILPMAVFAADTYELASSIAVGDTVVLAYTSGTMELNGISNTSTKYGLGVAYSSAPAGAYPLTVEAGYESGTYSFKCPNGQYLYWTSGNSMATNATKNANTSWTVEFSGDNAIIKNAKDTARQIFWNASSPRFACYTTTSQKAVQLFKLVTGGTDEPECEHDWVSEQTKAPDCTNAGENTLTCSKCGESKTETVDALGHTFVDGFCSVCNEPQPLEATITFDNKDKRTEYTSAIQVWKENGITVTNNKASSTTNVGDYANPVRLYAKSSVTIEYPGMTKIDFVCNGSSYVTALKNSIGATAAVTTNGNTVTLTLGSALNSYTIAQLTAQVQLKSITVYGSACEHDYVGVETQAPTCSAEGVMTYTCSKCEESYTEAIATIPHDYVEDIIPATCTTTGTKTYECSVCFDSYDEVIPLAPHNYVDDVCADCGHVKAYKGTITFDVDKTQRTECTTSVQKWENGGLTLINNKADSTTDINSDYYGRFYKSSSIIIEFPEMSTLIIDASGIGNDYLWDATLEAAGLSFTVENKIYTITFDEPENSLELTCANQVRANSITAIVAHDCAYDNAFDVDCNKCGAIREVETVITNNGTSASPDVLGVAALFTLKVDGMGIKDTTAIYDNATVNGCKLISMGAIASNGVSQKNIPVVYLCDDDVSASAKFAIRVIKIPADKLDVEITFTPYFVVEIDGEQTTIYGEAQSASYAEKIG